MTTPYPSLFQPIRIGPREAKNRIMRVATTANLADCNRAGERVLAFYRTLARGGVGTIVTEALRANPLDPFGPGAITIFDRGGLDGLRRVADVCHEEGALLIGQLNMGGRQHLASRVVPYLIAPSAIPCPRSGGVPHELTTREVKETIETYITCAAHCVEAGMDGVEIHGAQGHLIQQFLSPFTNRRNDDYGGSAENRMRFAREILEGVRRRIGPDVIVGYRMGAEEFTEGGLSVDDNVEIAHRFCRDGLTDYLSLAQGNFNSIEQHLPDRHWPILAFRDIHSRFKAASNGIPVIASTRIQSPEQAESVIRQGEADMIGLCRALIVDPDWPQKAERAEADRIRRCIACNQCWAWISTGEPIACATNPVTGREYQWGPLDSDRAQSARHVVVIGGGPAGLEAARVAALRGHQVTLLERDDVVGGRIRHASSVRHHEEMRHLLDFLVPEAERADVDIRTGVTVDGSAVAALRPDHVIIATGAAAAVPDLPSDGSVPLITSDGNVEIDRGGRNIVIMDEDGYYWTSVVADSVMAQGRTPVIATRFFEVAREIPVVSRIAFLREVYRNGGTLVPNTAVTRISQGRVVLANYLTGREEEISDVAAVVWVGFALPGGAHLAQEIEAAGIERRNIHVIGDAKQPRRLFNALFEGHGIALTIGSEAG